jgi:hypothetical protein
LSMVDRWDESREPVARASGTRSDPPGL